MAQRRGVTLSKAGRSWVAYYYDSTGKRCGKSLGLVKGHSANRTKGINQRQARVLRDRLAVELKTNPAISAHAPRLGDFLNQYLESRNDLKPSTKKLHEMTCRYIESYFGSGVRIDRIDRAGTRAWHSALAQGTLASVRRSKQFDGHQLTVATICRCVREAKAIFSRAVDDDLIPFNPFTRLKGKAPEPDKDWKYVSFDEFDRLLDVCPNAGWRAFLGLCRISGLRRGEALGLEWPQVDWETKRLTVIAQKTGKRRIVPIEPCLHGLLLEAFEAAEPGDPFVLPASMVSRSSVRKRFEAIIRQAGLVQWQNLFQVLRRNRETDWAQKYPQYVVSYWMGHDMKVSEEHYLQVPSELYEKAARDKDAASEGGRSNRNLQNNCKTHADMRRDDDAQVLVGTEYPRQGSNLQPSAPEADALSN